MTRIKVDGITTLEDARFCAAVGVDYLGFEQDVTSARYVMPAQAREIVDWVVGPEPVGLFPAGAAMREVLDACAAAGFRMAQLPDAAPEVCAAIEAAGIPVIRSFSVYHDASAEQLLALVDPYAGAARFARLDTHGTSLWGGTGESIGWRAVRELAGACDLFLAGAIDSANVADASRMQPFALDVCASVEESPGLLDFDKLGELVRTLESLP